VDASDRCEGSAEETAWANQVILEGADLGWHFLTPSPREKAKNSEEESGIGHAFKLRARKSQETIRQEMIRQEMIRATTLQGQVLAR